MEQPEKYNVIIKDKILFNPYMNDGWQSIMQTAKGKMSIRYKGKNLLTDDKHPYEVWYPKDDVSTGYQTAEDIFNYLGTKIENVI